MSEWKLEKYNHPSGTYIIKHDKDHIEAGRVFDRPHFVWPHFFNSDSDFYEFGHCMTCKEKAPDILITQLRVLNGT